MHVTSWGRTGPRVVLVHGSAQGSEVSGVRHFARQEALVGRGWQLQVPDRPGHGLSPAPGRPDDAELDGELISDLLGDGAHLVGHSFGGCVALAAAARRPQAVHSLTLIEPAMMRIAVADPAVRRFALKMASVLYLSFSPITRIRRFAKLVNIPDSIRGGSDDTTLRRMGQGIARLRLPAKATLERQLRVVSEAGIPLLVVTGGWNDAFEATADAVAQVGQGRRLVIPSEHHFPQAVSDEFNEALDRFMADAATPRTLA